MSQLSPEFREPQSEILHISVNARELGQAVKKTSFATTKNPEMISERPYLEGLSIKFTQDNVEFTGADSYRISWLKIGINSHMGFGTGHALVNANLLKNGINNFIPKRKKDYVADLRLTYSALEVNSPIHGAGFYLPLMQDSQKLSDWRSQLIPETKGGFTFETEKLIEAIHKLDAPDELMFFPNNDNKNITLFKPGSMGRMHEVTQILEGSLPGNITLNTNHVLELFKNVKSEVFTMEIKDHKHPAVFTIPDNDNFLYLTMPLTTDSA